MIYKALTTRKQTTNYTLKITHKIKKNYIFEPYLKLYDKYHRRNITSIRISTHNLPIERLRKSNVARNLRKCNLCQTGALGTEEHTLIFCMNPELTRIRNDLYNKIKSISYQFNQHTTDQLKFLYLVNAQDRDMQFYFAIFLDKVYKHVKLMTHVSI